MFQPDFDQTAEPAPAALARLSGAAGLAPFHRRRAWRVGHAVRAAGAVPRHADCYARSLTAFRSLGWTSPGFPNLDRLNERLERLTGWRCVSVPGLVPDDAFFAMLAERRFPIGNFIRSADSLDYLEEPDCFHDIFGHVPLLAHEPVARLMQAMGRLGRRGDCRRPWRDDLAALLAHGRVRPGARRRRSEDPRRRPRFQLRRSAFRDRGRCPAPALHAQGCRRDGLPQRCVPAALFRVGFARDDCGRCAGSRSTLRA